jgi:hypothetical protein
VTLKTDAAEVARSKTAVNALSNAAFDRLQGFYLSDPFEFSVVVCGHEDLNEDFHRPLAYCMAGSVDLLIPILNDPRQQSFTVNAIRKEIRRHGVDWNATGGSDALSQLLLFQDHRLFRGSGKSTLAHDIDLWKVTNDPNLSTVIFSVSEERAISFMRPVQKVIMGDIYRQLFPNRVPDDEARDLTEKRITLKGRTVNSPQATLESWGYTSRFVGAHWARFSVDDLQVWENSSETHTENVKRFRAGLPALEEPGIRRPVENLSVGTVQREGGDQSFNEKVDHCPASGAESFDTERPHCFLLRIPIEKHDTYVHNILERGTPTHSWFPKKKVAAKQAVVLAEESAEVWRGDFLMDTSLGDGKMFPEWLLKEAVFEWRQVDGRVAVARRRFLVDADGKKQPLFDADGKELWKVTPVNRLDRVFGCDIAVSDEDTADNWAICCLGRDDEDFEYELEVQADIGWGGFEEMLELMYDSWRPRRIGFEKAGLQEALVNLMKQQRRFQKLRSRLVPIPHNNKAKSFRIRNNVAERMKMGVLLGNPDDAEMLAEKRNYRPGDNATDDRLDAESVATVMSRKGRNNDDYDQEEAAKRQQMRMRRATDPFTGVPLL